MENKKTRTVVVIGGGAAGFFAAIHATENPALKVCILERSGKILSKVKISGGGRCNVTNACDRISKMASGYPRGRHFVKKTFRDYFTTDTIRWFESHGVPLKTEADGRVFPVSDRSQTIIDCLVTTAMQKKIDIIPHSTVVQVQKREDKFQLFLGNGECVSADFVVVACGGLPKIQMYEWLKFSGHQIVPPVPSLFTFNLNKHPLTRLMGISVPKVTVRIPGTKLLETGALLITHWGLSGPAILRLSAWGARLLQEKNWQFTIQINWLADNDEETLGQEFQTFRKTLSQQLVHHKNPFGLPQRLWQFLVIHSGIKNPLPWGALPAKSQNKLIHNLSAFDLSVSGKTTFKEEFVTAGGVSLSEINSETMESKLVKGLYFAGEVIDIDGITGGFNFQNAWTTGYIAGNAIAQQSDPPT